MTKRAENPFLDRAEQLHRQGDLSGAIDQCTFAIQKDPTDHRAWCNRGALLIMKSEYISAVSDCRTAIRLKNDMALAYYNLALAYERLGRLREALQEYTNAIELDPTHGDAWNNRGIVKGQLKMLEESLGDFTEAIRLGPDADALLNRALANFQLGRLADAVLDARQAIECSHGDWPHLSAALKTFKELQVAHEKEYQKRLGN